MTHSLPVSAGPIGHVIHVGGVIGLLSTLLCAGLSFLGIIERINEALMGLVVDQGISHSVPTMAIWLAILVLALGVPWILLGISSAWRRLILWVTVVVVTCGWLPVLALAAYAPDLAGPIVACVWSGICTLVYSSIHPMASDFPLKTVTDETR